MKRSIFFLWILLLASSELNGQDLGDYLNEYWSASSSHKKNRIAQEIISKKFSLEEVKKKLKEGKRYSSAVKKGFFRIKQTDDLLPPSALIFVPLQYDPSKKYPVTIFLHGAVSNLDKDFLYKRFVDTTSIAFREVQSILIYPSSWILSPWWSETQEANINGLLAYVKNNYNIDENFVRLAGISDGATGCFFLANCNTTPWSCITPFIGSLIATDGLSPRQTYMNNLSTSPFLVVNTGRDPIFPKADQVPYLNLLKQINRKAHVIWVDSSGHSMQWYSVLKDSISSFVKHQPRNPYPAEITWQTENEKKYGRSFFVLVDDIDKTDSNENISDSNEISISGRKATAFKRNDLSGVINVKRKGNTFHVNTLNVKKYRLLLSSDFVDYKKPITVFTNGTKSFEGTILPNLKTLFHWNILDNDRSMLFDAELKIKLH